MSRSRLAIFQSITNRGRIIAGFDAFFRNDNSELKNPHLCQNFLSIIQIVIDLLY
jgi:hypothetical protein